MVQPYELTALTPPGSLTAEDIISTLCINSQGLVAGSGGSIGQRVAFVYDGRQIHLIDALRPYSAIVQNISDSGHIVGHIVPGHGTQTRMHSFVLHRERLDILDTDEKSDSYVVAVNNWGHILVRHNGWQSFIYKHKKLHPLDPGDVYRLQGWSINDADHVVGIGSVQGQRVRTGGAFIYRNNTLSFIPKLEIGSVDERISGAYALNNAGQIVGMSGSITGAQHAFLADERTVYDLGTLRSWWSNALAINHHGDVVGYSSPPHSRKLHSQALLWHKQTCINLNNYTRGTGWNLKMAVDINDKGQIVGWGIFHGVS